MPMEDLIRKEDIIDFFNERASEWDARLVRNEAAISDILDAAGITEGVRVLDVACGTGVLFPDYLKRKTASVLGVDISPSMVEIARNKFARTGVDVLCADIMETDLSACFDRVVVYNAFPHFPDPAALIERLCGVLSPGGRLTIAHSMSRAQLDRHHSGAASGVSVGLMHEDELATLMGRKLAVDIKISTHDRFIVSGTRA